MRTPIKLWAVGLLTVAFVVMLAWSSPNAELRPPSLHAAPNRGTTPQEGPAYNVKDTAPHVISHPAEVLWNPLNGYAAVVDGRSFVLSAWEHPSQGGRYYASNVAAGCSFVKNITESLSLAQPEISVVGASNYLAASQALSKLQTRCGQFTDEELEFYSIASAGKEHKDRLFELGSKFSKASIQGDESKEAEALHLIFESKDPLLIDKMGVRLLAHNDLRAFYFNGQAYAFSQKDGDIVPAMYLAPCLLGLPCDASDPDLMISCASGAGCYESRMEKLHKTLDAGENRLPHIAQLSVEIATAIRADDVNKFTPQRK